LNTRKAYFRNAVKFLRWCEARGLRDLKEIRPVVVAAYIEELGTLRSKPSVKQSLATIRMLFDWLVTGEIVSTNPASSGRGPKHVVKVGKTPVLRADEARALLDSIPTTRETKKPGGEKAEVPIVTGLRDRAIIAAMLFALARVGAM